MKEQSDAQAFTHRLCKIHEVNFTFLLKMNKHSKPVLKQFVTVTSHFFCIVLSGHSSFNRISGDAGYVVPPVPIPNTVVKHSYAESTCLEMDWEDRALPV